MRDEQTKYQAKRVQTIGVNYASIEGHEKYTRKFKFNFPLASDPDRKVAAAYHALKPGSTSIARTVYLVGTDGTIRFAQRGMPSVDAILEPLG